MFRRLFVVAGVLALGMACLIGSSLLGDFHWGGLVGCLIFLVVGSAFLLVQGKLKEPPIIIDKGLCLIKGNSLTLGKIEGEDIPIRNVRFLQLCSGPQVEPGDGSGYTAYQLNLVLVKPSGRRVMLVTHGNERALRQDAQRLAEFLGVPLLDHTTESRAKTE
jgi:hypothetical protein